MANFAVTNEECKKVTPGHVYTGQADGWVVQVTPEGDVRKIRRMSVNNCGQPGAGEDACGRPLGIRVDNAGYLVVADAYNGLIRINPSTGQFKHLVDSRTQEVNGKKLGYINDLTIAKDGTIFFTSSSTKWTYLKENNIIFEAENTGRVLFYNPREVRRDQQVQELVTELKFPNGIELAEDENSLLIGEGSRSRILRAWIGTDHPKRGSLEVFANNLPGVVDNIRRSPRGTFWVGISQSRHRAMPSVLDTYGNDTKVRGALISMVNKNVRFDNPKFGVTVELGRDGKILRSLQDPYGKIYTSVSQVSEEDGLLYVASPAKKFVGVLNLQVINASQSGDFSGGLSKHPLVDDFLEQVRKNMLMMPSEKVKLAVLELVRELIVSKRQTAFLTKISAVKQMEVNRLKKILAAIVNATREQATQSGGGATNGGGGGAVTAAPSGPTTTTSSSSGAGGVVTSSGGAVTTPAANPTTLAPAPTTPAPTTPAATQAPVTTAAPASSGTTLFRE